MSNAYYQVPPPRNEAARDYAPGSAEKARLKARIVELRSQAWDIPVIVGGKEIRTGRTRPLSCPHNHGLNLGVFHQAGPAEVEQAIAAALKAREDWARMPWEHRVAVFLKAADMLTGPWRDTINAATMLGQSKTAHQSEIEAACELADFWRFNCHYLTEIMAGQPLSSPGVWNRLEYRPLEGFVLAVTPFNFTAIGGNLPTAPAMAGNVALWKPASTAVLSNYLVFKLLEEAGMPPGVINFLPGSGAAVGDTALDSPHLAGIHFTGSTGTFQYLWQGVGSRVDRYRAYPRLVGETGGKDFIFVHASADLNALVPAAIRGAYEYQGQKCSAASRMYIPQSLWPAFEERFRAEVAAIRMGDVEDFRNFMSAVIDRASFEKISEYIAHAQNAPEARVITDGAPQGDKGWFVPPTAIVTTDPKFRTMREEIFGPVLTVFVYPDDKLEETLTLCDETSPYGLTGAIFARDRRAVVHMSERLCQAAGNFYINDKPTGAVVGQQPFGGARASGTNDKAGFSINLLRWMSVRSIKETLVPPTDWRYPFLDEA